MQLFFIPLCCILSYVIVFHSRVMYSVPLHCLICLCVPFHCIVFHFDFVVSIVLTSQNAFRRWHSCQMRQATCRVDAPTWSTSPSLPWRSARRRRWRGGPTSLTTEMDTVRSNTARTTVSIWRTNREDMTSTSSVVTLSYNNTLFANLNTMKSLFKINLK